MAATVTIGGIRFTGVPTAGVRTPLLLDIAKAVKAIGGTQVVVTSGKRPPGPGNDVKDSNHITGNAIDGYAVVKGQQIPIGKAILPVAGKFGLRSGDVAGFDPKTQGGWDPIHVDDGANVGGVKPTAATGTKPTGTNYVSFAEQAARKAGINPVFFVRQINQESGFNPTAKSSAGAEGIAQIVPKYHPGVDPMNPEAALTYAAHYMAGLVTKYDGSYAKALSVYNSGNPTAYLDSHFAKGQTYNYVKDILGSDTVPKNLEAKYTAPVVGNTPPAVVATKAPPVAATPVSTGNPLSSVLAQLAANQPAVAPPAQAVTIPQSTGGFQLPTLAHYAPQPITLPVGQNAQAATPSFTNLLGALNTAAAPRSPFR